MGERPHLRALTRKDEPVKSFLGRLRTQSLRVLMLAGLLLLSGAALGLAAAYPLTFFSYDESSAVRLDQARLAGQVDVNQALVTLDDLPKGWEAGDANLGPFGVMNSTFCGETVATPNPLSDVRSVVFKDPTNDSLVIAQAMHVDKWQSAKTYINDVGDAMGGCDQFYRTGPAGQTKIEIRDPAQAPLIAEDYVGATYVDASGTGVQEWALFSVGDVIVSVMHSGPTRPEPPFMNDVIGNVLARIDPTDFAAGGIAPTTTVDSAGAGSGTVDSGSADETGGGDGSNDPAATTAPPAAPTTAAPPTAAPTTVQSKAPRPTTVAPRPATTAPKAATTAPRVPTTSIVTGKRG